MNPNRKAEIQRKLTLTAVPKPPDGLADRIKRDIPNYLQATEVERERFSRSIGFTMRVAASILLLVTSVFVTINLLVPDQPRMKSSPTAAAAPQQRSVALRDAATASTAAVDVLRVEISEEQQPLPRVAETSRVAETASLDAPGATRRDDDARGRLEKLEIGASSAGVAMAEAVAPPPPPPASPEPAPAPVAEMNTITANAPMGAAAKTSARAASPTFVREAIAADLALGPKQSVFGISVDPHAFERLRTTIERGSRPAASTVNVEALVNYFAGAPKAVRREAQLEAEGSPGPVDVNGRRGIVRFTVDTRSGAVEGNASIPPVGTNARIEVVFNKHAVAGYERIGDDMDDGSAIAPETTLLGNTSVTGLYAIDLKPGVNKRTRIATVTLRYKSVADGREKSRFVVVLGADFARTWTAASRRHRLASLGAVWGESLKGSGGGSDVAMKAEELATQAPNDAKAKELAAAASASSAGDK